LFLPHAAAATNNVVRIIEKTFFMFVQNGACRYIYPSFRMLDVSQAGTAESKRDQ
jgi:hypothetical protein